MTRDDLRTAFCAMFGVRDVYDFQIEVAYVLLVEKKSVILQAPTGSGKTWTALFPFLLAWLLGLEFPQKCLYAVPLRVLTQQFQENALNILSSWQQEGRPDIRIQTGDNQGDRLFESDLIFTTIDQVLSSGLSVPYSLSRRQANMNAGAIFSSYVVCDELHLFPLDEQTAQGALATLVELLREFRGAFPFLLMTATLSEEMLQTLSDELHAERVMVSKQELATIASQNKTRRYTVVQDTLTAQAVLAHHQMRSIALCNQVPRAIELYEELCKAVDADPYHAGRTGVLLLHSRFTKRHRTGKEKVIRRQLRKVQRLPLQAFRMESLIIVATQVIEVGLDITCEHLHTELAPANAVIQRAGRCARYEGEEGDVWIYQLPLRGGQDALEGFEGDTVQRSYLPYDKQRCEATWDAFCLEQYNGKALSFLEEQQIVSLVHNPTDKKLFKKIFDERYGRWQDMLAAMFLGNKEGRARLIRAVDSRTLLIHDDPAHIGSPYTWNGFSLFHGTLRGWIHDLKEAGRLRIGQHWMIHYPVEVEQDASPGSGDPLKDVHRPIEYTWEPVTHVGMVDLSPIFVVHPRLVSYDRQRGLQLQPSTKALVIADLEQEPPAESTRRPFETRYALEHYDQHIGRMLNVYQNTSTLERQLRLAAQRIAALPESVLPAASLERAVLLALALHDVGKLQQEWQEWSHAYQREIEESQEENTMIVHTHYTPKEEVLHRQAEETLKNLKRPPHAAEGAWASWPMLLEALDHNERLAQAVFTAITRHHSAFSTTITPYTLHSVATQAIEAALATVGLPRHLAGFVVMEERFFPAHGALDDMFIVQGDMQQWLVYALIVRTLRLCDGRSLEGM